MTSLSSMGEFGFLEKLKARFGNMDPALPMGMGDDAAVLPSGDKENYALFSSDMLLEGTHFDISYTPMESLGYKAVSVNVSDMIAMNGRGKYIVVGLGMSARYGWEDVKSLYEGMERACKEYDISLVGGDTVSHSKGLLLSLAIWGEVPKASVTYRKGAKPHDVLCVTGSLGASYVGLQLLIREKRTVLSDPTLSPEIAEYAPMIQQHLFPQARQDILNFLESQNIVPHAMIDISDGLSSEILHLCSASGCGVEVYEDRLPIKESTYRTALEIGLEPLTCAMNGGEDYQLLMALPPQIYETATSCGDIHAIGYFVENPSHISLKTKAEQEISLTAQGWTQF
ncbi:MAG: thiamine-phosphate kinase [Cytophagales bacterium]|nr:thiamine-phosphate kinase [Cytophagales bacterium]